MSNDSYSPFRAPTATQVLLKESFDYAGIFPPVRRPMIQAVREYAGCSVGPHMQMLGRFVLPVSLLGEFEAAYLTLYGGVTRHWRLSVLSGPELTQDQRAIAEFNHRHPQVRIISVEAKATTVMEIARLGQTFPDTLELWIEVPPAPDPAPLLQAIKSIGRGAKLRTGGVRLTDVPSAAEIARFLKCCHSLGVVCKLTSGLHHPLCGEFPSTDDPAGRRAKMFGFVNVFLAAALIQRGADEATVFAMLDEADPARFEVRRDELTWRDIPFNAQDLALIRQRLCRSLGTCSFTEPLAGLQAMKWL